MTKKDVYNDLRNFFLSRMDKKLKTGDFSKGEILKKLKLYGELLSMTEPDLYPSIDDSIMLQLTNEILESYTKYEVPQIIEKQNSVHEKWLLKEKENIDFYLFEAYKKYLKEDKKMSADSNMRIDEITDEILDRIGNPIENKKFEIYGLVVGNVQSGKTANYLGLINKAFDSGYSIVIVLAGMLNSLRYQTQLRVDEGIVGFDSKSDRRTSTIGVSK